MQKFTNILVTGGAGFIGSHTCKSLKLRGYQPVVLDNLSRGHGEMVKWGKLVVGDIRDTLLVCEILRAYNIDAVMHFAALANVGESISKPADYYDVNVCGTLSVLNAMREQRVGAIIFSSTCATYGIPALVPVDETAPQRPINPYGRSKVVAEIALRDFASAYSMQIGSLRYFNAAGADGDGDLYQRSESMSHLVPLAIKAACGLTDRLEIFGTDYPTPDGTCIRDYIHVSDLALGHILALEALRAGAGGELFLNLGTGQGHSVREVVDMVAGSHRSKSSGRERSPP